MEMGGGEWMGRKRGGGGMEVCVTFCLRDLISASFSCSASKGNLKLRAPGPIPPSRIQLTLSWVDRVVLS